MLGLLVVSKETVQIRLSQRLDGPRLRLVSEVPPARQSHNAGIGSCAQNATAAA